jgi:peptide/nickel transport system permease protein
MLFGRLIDVVLSFPPIILGVMVTGILGPTTVNLVFALAVVYMPIFFRVARSGAMAEANLTYVEAARGIGLSEPTILWRHVTRNVMPLLLVQYMVLFPLVLQMQSALGFLGLGVQPPAPDWGAILQQSKDYILLAPWMSAFPGLAILVAALALMLIGRGLQRRLDRR